MLGDISLPILYQSVPLWPSVDYFQLEVLFERLKIAIVVEEWKAALDTEGGDPTIHNLADGEPLGSKLAIICRTLNGVASADHWSTERNSLSESIPWRTSLTMTSPRAASPRRMTTSSKFVCSVFASRKKSIQTVVSMIAGTMSSDSRGVEVSLPMDLASE